MQTDFGGIYFKNPSNIFKPKTIEELSEVCSNLYQKKIPWVVRNTGHSVNGQTLTNGFQIDLSQLKKIYFDKENLQVTVGAGNTWMEVFQGILFPKHALPVFPNNPGQNIQIGGTVSVGGIGPYSFKYGGLWNHIVKMKIVLPNGQILEVSENQNQELFLYSIAGFGKISIIAEITFKVAKSRSKVAMFEILDFRDQGFFEHLKIAQKSPQIVGLTGISKGDKLLNILEPNALMMILESENMLVEMEDLKKQFRDAPLKLILKEHRDEFFSFTKRYTEISKSTIFEYYPVDLSKDHLQGIHPWSDYILDFEGYQKFLPFLRDVISHYDLEKYIITQSFYKNKLKINIVPTYICRNFYKKFPLVPEIESDFSYGIGLMPTIPDKMIDKTLEAIKLLTKEAYRLKGKRYLYGIHHLDEKDLITQFGEQNLATWRELKRNVDPLNLLNPHVIFQ